MKQLLKISLVLTSICLVCAFLLALVYNAAEAKIEANRKKAIQESIKKLAPDATEYKKIEVNGEDLWRLYQNDLLVGYAVIASGQGYGGIIRVMAVLDSGLEKIQGIEIIEDSETPGLGSRIREETFIKHFRNLEVEKPILYTRGQPTEPNQIKAITGATISSRSVVEILNKKISKLQEKIK